MGFWSGLGSAISSACSYVSSAVSSIGSALVSSASKLLDIAGTRLSPIVAIIQIVATLIGVLTKEDDVEELGAKAMQPESKKPEDFDSNAEYIEYLREEVKLDKEKFDKAGDVEKTARTAVGASIVAKGISEQKGFDIPLETWVAMAKLNLTDKAQEVDKLLETFKDGKLEDFAKYVDGKLDIKKEGEIGDELVDMYKELEPNTSIEEIEDRVMKMDVGGK